MGCCCGKNEPTTSGYKRLSKEQVVANYGATGNPIKIERYGQPLGKNWYHGDIGDREAERRMRDQAVGVNGAFLVYDNPIRKDGYKIMAFKDGRIHPFNIRLRQSDSKYLIQGQNNREGEFYTVKELIHYHRGVRGVPIKLPRDETLVLNKGFKWRH